MRNNAVKGLFCILCCVLSGTAFAAKKKAVAAPDWVTAGSVTEVYPNSKYIVRRADASTLDEAKIKALDQIAQYFQAAIESNTDANTSMVSTNVNGSTSYAEQKSIIKKVNVKSDVDLFGVQYETFELVTKKGSKYYCAAFINREECYDIIEQKMLQKRRSFNSFYKLGVEAAEKGDTLSASRYYVKSLPYALEFIDMANYASLILPKKADEYEDDCLVMSSLKSKISKMNMANVMILRVNGDINGTIYATIKDLFSNEGFVVRDGSQTGKYKIDVNIDLNHRPDGELYVVNPNMDLTIAGVKGVVFSYSKSLEKIKSFQPETVVKTSNNKLLEEIKATLIKEFYDNI